MTWSSGEIEIAGDVLQEACYSAALKSGWHNDIATGKLRTPEANKALFATRIALVMTELAEAVEGDRKGLVSDHLPGMAMVDEEVADAVIRIYDLQGAHDSQTGACMAELIPIYAKYGQETVALSKALFALFNIAEAAGCNLGGAVAAKLSYNAKRQDHTLAHRQAEGGKKY